MPGPLSRTDISSRQPALQRFIDVGVDTVTPSESRNAALLIACECGTLEAAEVLLNADCDPCFADSNGRTSLSLVTQLILTEAAILKSLLDRGVDFFTVDNKGMYSLHYAVER